MRRPSIQPATVIYAQTGNRTHSPLVYRIMLQPTEPPSQGETPNCNHLLMLDHNVSVIFLYVCFDYSFYLFILFKVYIVSISLFQNALFTVHQTQREKLSLKKIENFLFLFKIQTSCPGRASISLRPEVACCSP